MTNLLTRMPTRTRRPSRSNLFDEFMSPSTGTESTVWSPALDLAETSRGFEIAIDLPGLSREDVTITYEDGNLKISGERALPQQETDPQYHRLERWQGRFFRRLRFGDGINPDGIEARFQDGVLQVHVPKVKERQPRRIKIK